MKTKLPFTDIADEKFAFTVIDKTRTKWDVYRFTKGTKRLTVAVRFDKKQKEVLVGAFEIGILNKEQIIEKINMTKK